MSDHAPPFVVLFDPSSRILYLKMMGFWTIETVVEFTTAIRLTVDRITDKSFDVLSESVDFPVQSPAVSDALAAMTAGFQSRWPGRVALAVKRVLNKLQVDRTMGGPKVMAFLTV